MAYNFLHVTNDFTEEEFNTSKSIHCLNIDSWMLYLNQFTPEAFKNKLLCVINDDVLNYAEYDCFIQCDHVFNSVPAINIDNVEERYNKIYGKITDQDIILAILISLGEKYKTQSVYKNDKYVYAYHISNNEYHREVKDMITNKQYDKAIFDYKKIKLYEYDNNLFTVYETTVSRFNIILTAFIQETYCKQSIEYTKLNAKQFRFLLVIRISNETRMCPKALQEEYNITMPPLTDPWTLEDYITKGNTALLKYNKNNLDDVKQYIPPSFPRFYN